MKESFEIRGFIILLLFIAVISYFSMQQRKDINNHGIITKCTIISSEGYKGGKIIKFNYKYRGKEYQANDGGMIGVNSIGKQFFIKLLANTPKEVTLLDNAPVPACFLNIEAPYEGWKVIPTCK